jgi:hypothetical protein
MLSCRSKSLSKVIYGLIAGLLLWSAYCPAAQPDPRPFVPGSLPNILAERQDRPFLLILWSVECQPCRKELDLLANARREYPMLELVLIATDDAAHAEEVRAALAKHGLSDVESWIFANSHAQRLRYEIDSAWYGELPRSYFYDARHERVTVSGALQPRHLEAWLAAIQP